MRAKKSENNLKTLAEATSEMQTYEKTKALEAAQEKGASNWLNTLPLKAQGFNLDKQTFRDAIYTRYRIPLKKLPSNCVCGAVFSVYHRLNCKKGGFISSRHNEITRLTY